jgi:hypothetical protein
METGLKKESEKPGPPWDVDAKNPVSLRDQISGEDIESGTIPSDAMVNAYIIIVKCIADSTALTTGDGKGSFVVPPELHGMRLVSCGAHVFTVSTSGLPTIQLRKNASTDLLSTRITIDANETDSVVAATPAVISTGIAGVVTADEIYIDVDVAGTGAKGLEVRMGFNAL